MNSRAWPERRKEIIKDWHRLHKRIDAVQSTDLGGYAPVIMREIVDLLHNCIYWIVLEEANRACLSGKVGPSKVSLYL